MDSVTSAIERGQGERGQGERGQGERTCGAVLAPTVAGRIVRTWTDCTDLDGLYGPGRIVRTRTGPDGSGRVRTECTGPDGMYGPGRTRTDRTDRTDSTDNNIHSTAHIIQYVLCSYLLACDH